MIPGTGGVGWFSGCVGTPHEIRQYTKNTYLPLERLSVDNLGHFPYPCPHPYGTLPGKVSTSRGGSEAITIAATGLAALASRCGRPKQPAEILASLRNLSDSGRTRTPHKTSQAFRENGGWRRQGGNEGRHGGGRASLEDSVGIQPPKPRETINRKHAPLT